MTRHDKGSVRGPAGVGLMFASNGAIFAALLPWYPSIADRLGLGAAQFGVIVAAFAVGAITSSALPTPLIARFGPVSVAVTGTLLLGAGLCLAASAQSPWVFALGVFFAGFFDAVVDVAQNVSGIRVQDHLGRPILSSMHALWSLGGVAGGALSTAAAARGDAMLSQVGLVALACVALVVTGGILTHTVVDAAPGEVVDAHDSFDRSGRFRAIMVAALPIVVIAICGTMVEDVANNWAAMAGVQIAGLSTGVAGVAFTVMIGSQCLGRFTGDLLIGRIGRSAVARIGGFLIASGALTVAFANPEHPGNFYVGLAMLGFGSATLVPSALTAAARIPGLGESAGVTLVSWLMRIGFLVTSPLIGSITDAIGLRAGFGVLVVAGLAAAVLAGAVSSRGSERAVAEVH